MDTVFDYIIIGSGFGGSVSAHRLTEKGYKVLVIEKGKRFKNSDFPKTNWNLRKYLWMPQFGLHGIQRLNLFKHAFVLTGVGVGGGSLVYANTLMHPPKEFFQNNDWEKFNNWESTLEPFYKKAHFMLGRTKLNKFYIEDEILRDVARDLKKEESFDNVYVAVNYHSHNSAHDPYFNGEGPLRNSCTECAGCMVGCRENAKNTLDKNYLYFAEKNGARILPETRVWKINFNDNIYSVSCKNSMKPGGRKVFKANGIIVAGGVLGTLKLLLHQKYLFKTLPDLSPTLGKKVRTNSETLCTASAAKTKLNNGVAISSIFRPQPDTYIEIVKYPTGSNVMKYLLSLATGEAKLPFIRTFKFIGNCMVHPVKFARMFFNGKWAHNTIIFLVMQSADNAMKVVLRKGLLRKRITFKNNQANKVNAYIPIGQEVMNRYAKKTGAIPQNSAMELLFNIPSTAHILGGAPMGDSDRNGLIDKNFRVFNYPNMYVVDGSAIQGNLGVNPSYTIAAIAEYAMDQIPAKTASNLASR